MKSKLLFTVISVTVLISLIVNASAIAFALDSNSSYSSKEIAELMKKDFADDRVIVVLKQEDSLAFNEYSPSSFPEIDCEQVYRLSNSIESKVKYALDSAQNDIINQRTPAVNEEWNFSNFNSIMSLKLSTPGKENVIKAIEKIILMIDEGRYDHIIGIANINDIL